MYTAVFGSDYVVCKDFANFKRDCRYLTIAGT